MADNFLEYHREEYERKKAEWLKRKEGLKNKPTKKHPAIEKPEDEAL